MANKVLRRRCGNCKAHVRCTYDSDTEWYLCNDCLTRLIAARQGASPAAKRAKRNDHWAIGRLEIETRQYRRSSGDTRQRESA